MEWEQREWGGASKREQPEIGNVEMTAVRGRRVATEACDASTCPGEPNSKRSWKVDEEGWKSRESQTETREESHPKR